MDDKALIKLCKELGCCDACCLRYIGVKNPLAYDKPQEYITRYQEQPPEDITEEKPEENSTNASENESIDEKGPEHESINSKGDGSESPPSKRKRSHVCVSCLGILQEDAWPECCDMFKEQLEKKRYECTTFACALSAPMVTLLREKAITLRLQDASPEYDPNYLTSLKESWKWRFGSRLADAASKELDSGAVSPLLITITFEYPNEVQELEILKILSPTLFASRSRQRRRFTVEFTRRSVEQALSDVTLSALRDVPGWGGLPAVEGGVQCVSVSCVHTPVYLGGRYLKFSRTLPQTPWLVGGKRMMESSVQEIIFEPIAKLYNMSPQEMEHRLKFMSAGREDVDVRCLGDGRPFAIEISDPCRKLSTDELRSACHEISSGGHVKVIRLVHVSKEDLTLLKTGEETKTKLYEALCIKLPPRGEDVEGRPPPVVTPEDIERINTFRNTPNGETARVVLQQRTPIRVLHRRPLLNRTRRILELRAELVPDQPRLFLVLVRTEAGTYIKEWAHGELGRTSPALGDAMGSPADILALDVKGIDLQWPVTRFHTG